MLGRNHEQPAIETGGEILFALIIVAFGIRVLDFTILLVERPVDKYLNKRLVFFNKLVIPVTALAFIYLASAFAMLLVEVLTELPALQK